MSRTHLITSESVAAGHPDKVADQISDAVLDALLQEDKSCRVACECLVTTGLAFISGEISTNAYADLPRVVRETIRDIGYTDPSYGFDWETCAVISSIDEQSPDIAQGVNRDSAHELDQGAGDQGIMFGYAVRETPELMPLPIQLAHKISARLGLVRSEGKVDFLGPDGKCQVTVEYDETDRPVRVHTIVLSAQHKAEVPIETVREALRSEVIVPVLPKDLADPEKIVYHINPTGRFVRGGPWADTGLTGRKIIVDTYGGLAPHGGGAFSGKDPSKVDRSATYAARWVAKNVVAAGLADRAQIQLAYAIGIAEPVSIHIETFGTHHADPEKILAAVRGSFDLRPRAIIRDLDLLRPMYRKTAAYGHFGRDDAGFPWERTDRVEMLKSHF
ncbi:MAG: methionine adenosyltransferase [Candidatus Eisenbacteria bacterium]|nr:methionine adenosyltransferase [Candidatus Eisenbacteria bacterium]